MFIEKTGQNVGQIGWTKIGEWDSIEDMENNPSEVPVSVGDELKYVTRFKGSNAAKCAQLQLNEWWNDNLKSHDVENYILNNYGVSVGLKEIDRDVKCYGDFYSKADVTIRYEVTSVSGTSSVGAIAISTLVGLAILAIIVGIIAVTVYLVLAFLKGAGTEMKIIMLIAAGSIAAISAAYLIRSFKGG